MKRLVGGVARSLRASESGFTLIEMLIVVGIIVALAAAIVPQVVQFGGKGEEGTKATELQTVQTAIDNAMAIAGITVVDVQATNAPNFSWTALPKVGADRGRQGHADRRKDLDDLLAALSRVQPGRGGDGTGDVDQVAGELNGPRGESNELRPAGRVRPTLADGSAPRRRSGAQKAGANDRRRD